MVRTIRITFNMFFWASLTIVVAIILIVELIPRFDVWQNGISALTQDSEEYYLVTDVIEAEYTINIDLANLANNEGKILYEDEDHKIYVQEVNEGNNSGYEIVFRSSGSYHVREATVVSGLEYIRSKDLIHEFQAEAKASYKGDSFNLEKASSSGLKYKDGDEFVYHFSPAEEGIELNLNENPELEVTVSNLYFNLWLRTDIYN